MNLPELPKPRRYFGHSLLSPMFDKEEMVEYAQAAIKLTIREFYGNGESLPVMHPDAKTNKDILISELCAKLDTARRALSQALEMNVVTPAAVAMKRNVRWALDETHPMRLQEQHPNCG